MKEQKGITLVALVITIIVLLILAGVSISLVMGNNGILTQASGAVVAQEKGTASSEVGMAASDALTNYWTGKASDITVKKSTYYAESEGSVFKNNCISATTLVIKYPKTAADTGYVYVRYTASSKDNYFYKIDVSTGKVEESTVDVYKGITGTDVETKAAIGTTDSSFAE
jgi:flagellar basal body-associated protein FliL